MNFSKKILKLRDSRIRTINQGKNEPNNENFYNDSLFNSTHDIQFVQKYKMADF